MVDWLKWGEVVLLLLFFTNHGGNEDGDEGRINKKEQKDKEKNTKEISKNNWANAKTGEVELRKNA